MNGTKLKTLKTLKNKVIYTDAPPEIEEAFANSRIIPNFIDIDSLVLRDGTRPNFINKKTRKSMRPSLKHVAAML